MMSSLATSTYGALYGGLTGIEGECLYRYCQTPGPHVDIGTHLGGSAHTAALAKNGSGHVYTIDPDKDVLVNVVGRLNAKMPDWRDRITIVNERSDAWDPPEPPATVLIDGSHKYEDCLADWEKYSAITTEYILFHDNDLGAVQKVIYVDALRHTDWEMIEEAKKVSVFKRVNDKA